MIAADINTALRDILESNGITVDPFDIPHDALEKFKPHFYDPLILDIKMPEMQDYEQSIELGVG